MDKTRCNTFNGAIHFGKTVLAAGALAVVMTACGGGHNEAADPEGAATNLAEATVEVMAKPAATAVSQAIGSIKPEELPKALLAGKFSDIYTQMAEEFRKQVSEAEFAGMAADFIKGIASFEQVSVMQHNGGKIRTWASDTKDKGLTAVFDDEGGILGIQIKELSYWLETDGTPTKIVYDLPLRGDWIVYWGGENALVNYHYEHEVQRYAYDIIQSKDGNSYKDDPLKNESYYAFGQPAYAPADGKIVTVVNDISDNEPVGVMNEKQPIGNAVVIDHGGNEYSTLAHLKKGSVSVKVGDQVKCGDKIGQVGNSGNSSEAHLHFQVSDGADLFKSKSINISWKDGIKPIQGETVTSAD